MRLVVDGDGVITDSKEIQSAVNSAEAVAEVFEHWRIIMGHSRARLDAVRAKVIKARLTDGYSVEDLCLAVDGCCASAFHMGDNDRQQVFDSITLILRDADHVDKFIRAGEKAHEMLSQREQRREAASTSPEPIKPTPEQVARARDLLKNLKLRRVA
jgi:hypothetical protein